MRAPVLIYYLTLFAFAWVTGLFFVNLGHALTRQYTMAEQAIQQEREVSSHNRREVFVILKK